MSWGITDWAYLVALIIFFLGFWAFVIWFLLRESKKKSNSKPQPPNRQKGKIAITPQKSFDREEYNRIYHVPEVKCPKCDGHMGICHGRYGYFVGCSNSNCKYTSNIYDFVRKIVVEYGIKIYSWPAFCQQCKKPIRFYSYDITYDFRKSIFRWLPADLVLGAIPELDTLLAHSQKYPTIKKSYSSVLGEAYSNVCEYCYCENYIDFGVAREAFSLSKAEEKFMVDCIKVRDETVVKAITNAIMRLYDDCRK